MKTDGPAFPATEEHGLNSGMPGMTLRDYFAAKAMPLAMARIRENLNKEGPKNWSWDDEDWDALANYAYAMADAMLEARKS